MPVFPLETVSEAISADFQSGSVARSWKLIECMLKTLLRRC